MAPAGLAAWLTALLALSAPSNAAEPPKASRTANPSTVLWPSDALPVAELASTYTSLTMPTPSATVESVSVPAAQLMHTPTTTRSPWTTLASGVYVPISWAVPRAAEASFSMHTPINMPTHAVVPSSPMNTPIHLLIPPPAEPTSFSVHTSVNTLIPSLAGPTLCSDHTRDSIPTPPPVSSRRDSKRGSPREPIIYRVVSDAEYTQYTTDIPWECSSAFLQHQRFMYGNQWQLPNWCYDERPALGYETAWAGKCLPDFQNGKCLEIAQSYYTPSTDLAKCPGFFSNHPHDYYLLGEAEVPKGCELQGVGPADLKDKNTGATHVAVDPDAPAVLAAAKATQPVEHGTGL